MIDRVPELRELARTLNFNTASRTLHMSQSTLTRHVASLERQLGFHLFERAPMRLTPEGSHYLAAAGQLYDKHESIVEECRAMAKRAQESVSVNMVVITRSLWGDIVYEAMSLVRERFPEAAPPHFCRNRDMTIEASVFCGIADIGMTFRESASLPEGFACSKLADYPLAAYFNRTSPLAAFDQIAFDDLKDSYLVCPTSLQLRSTFDGAVDAFRRNGIEPKYRVREIEDLNSVLFELADDEFMFGNHIPALNDPTIPLESRPMTGPNATYPVYLVYNTRSPKPATKTFVDICLEVAAPLRAEG